MHFLRLQKRILANDEPVDGYIGKELKKFRAMKSRAGKKFEDRAVGECRDQPGSWIHRAAKDGIVIDPDAAGNQLRFYRAVPEANPPPD